MASPENEVKIDLWIQEFAEGSAADLAAVRAQLIMWADRAEQGDQQAQRSLLGLHGGGITITPALTAPTLGGQAPTIAQEDFGDPGFQGLRAPPGGADPRDPFRRFTDWAFGWLSGSDEEPPQLPAQVRTIPIEGTNMVWPVNAEGEVIGSPIDPSRGVQGGSVGIEAERLRRAHDLGFISDADYREALTELALGATGGADEFADKELRDLTLAAERAEAAGNPELAAQYRVRIQQLLLGTGGTGGGITEFQSGQLEVQRGQLQLSREQSAIAAARAGNPLAYLGLTTGATPQEALSLIAPAPSQVTIQRGDPLGRPRLTGGGLRLPGVQALARETPMEAQARRERQAVEFGLSPEQSMAFSEQRKRLAGPRLPTPTFGGSIGR